MPDLAASAVPHPLGGLAAAHGHGRRGRGRGRRTKVCRRPV